MENKHKHGDITIGFDEETGWYIDQPNQDTIFKITQCPFCDKRLYTDEEIKKIRREQYYENDNEMAKLGRSVFNQYIGFKTKYVTPFRDLSGPASYIVNSIWQYVDGEA